jgi:GNAT superfamily N-acetyltransferase
MALHDDDTQPTLPVPGTVSSSPHGCVFVADAGLVCPATFCSADGHLRIEPFADCDAPLQQRVVQELGVVWPDTVSSVDKVRGHWQGTDVLYVLFRLPATTAGAAGAAGVRNTNCELMGTVAVDRHHFHAFISHVYVAPAYRGRGHALLLMRFAEAYAMRHSLTEARLWCAVDMMPFYERQGYALETMHNDQAVMMRPLQGRRRSSHVLPA